MTAALFDPVARLQTIDGFVQHFGMTFVDAGVTTAQALITEKVAAGFRRDAREVVGYGDGERSFWVAGTA